jgi:protein TonB
MSSARTVTTLALAAGLVAGTAARGDGPLALHSPPLAVPSDLASFAVAPEAAVRLTIDARGVVTAVEVRSIEPSTEHDERFREQLVSTYSEWRFAPATEDGRPVESELDWRVRFSPPGAVDETAAGPAEPLTGSDAEQRRAAVRALPEAARRAMLEAEIRAAMALFDAKRLRQTESPRFVVRTDGPSGVEDTVAGNLEAIFNLLARDLLPGIAPQPEPFKVQVFVYAKEAPFREFLSRQALLENSAGFYHAAGLIAFHLEMPSSEMLTGLLLHEGTHAFVDRHLVRAGVALPRWLGEGFAEYVGNSAIERGQLRPGKTVLQKYELGRGRVHAVETSAALRLDDAKAALRRGKGLGVRQLLEASPEIFYGENAGLFYASSWLLVHYLRDGEPGWASDRFPRFVLYLAEGYPQEAAFREVYGDSAAAEDAFRRYVQKF